MKIIMLTVGTVGALRPMLALSVGLRKAGHDVIIGSHEDFRTMIEEHGIGFSPIAAHSSGIASNNSRNRQFSSGGNPIRYLKALRIEAKELTKSAVTVLDRSLELCRGSDVVLYHDHMCFASAIPEYLDIPGIQAYNTPVTPTSEFPSYVRFRHSRHTTRFSNRLSFLLRDLVTSLPYRSFVNRWRAERFGFPRIGLTGQYRALDRQKCPLLYSISPTMLPRPADWPEWVHMTGYWHLKESTEYNPPEDLLSFLESGPPPVCIGFGSMRYESSETTTKIVVDAVKHCGYRAILLSGWQGMMKIDLPESIYMAIEIPHSWLFEHVSASVNAGGIGTLTTALKAGLPTLAVPFGGDNLFWGWQIERLGVGPEAIHVKNLTAPLLATRLKKLVELTGYRESAQEIATAMQSEDGVATAIDFIEKTVSST